MQKTGSFVITQYNPQGFKVEMSTQKITIQNNQIAELKSYVPEMEKYQEDQVLNLEKHLKTKTHNNKLEEILNLNETYYYY